MRKALIAAAAATIALAPISVLYFPAAQADPSTASPAPGGYIGPEDEGCPNAEAQQAAHPQPYWKAGCQAEKNDRCMMDSRCHIPGMPYPPGRTQAPITTPAQAPPTGGSPPVTTQAPATMPVQAPTVNPPSKPAVLAPPKGLDAPPQAVTAAKAAPATRVDPANPPKPLTQGDFHQLIKSVVDAHRGNVEVVTVNNQALVRPRHWQYLDYDSYHRPTLYNPLTEAMTFRYFYAGAYQEVTVAAGGRVVLDVGTAGVFPFTAVSDSYVASGSFTGGAWIPPEGWDGPPPPTYSPPAPPTVYHDVSANVPAGNQAVQVGSVTVVGHDDSQPAGSQDTFLIDDSTLAWGQVTDAKDGGQVTVTKTQSLPGIGPTDDGGVLVALAASPQPADNWWRWVLGGAALVIAVGLIAWVVMRRRRART
jgi:hypothetical protein